VKKKMFVSLWRHNRKYHRASDNEKQVPLVKCFITLNNGVKSM